MDGLGSHGGNTCIVGQIKGPGSESSLLFSSLTLNGHRLMLHFFFFLCKEVQSKKKVMGGLICTIIHNHWINGSCILLLCTFCINFFPFSSSPAAPSPQSSTASGKPPSPPAKLHRFRQSSTAAIPTFDVAACLAFTAKNGINVLPQRTTARRLGHLDRWQRTRS